MLGLAVAIDYALFIVSRYRARTAGGPRPGGGRGARAGHRGIGGGVRRADRGHRTGRPQRRRHPDPLRHRSRPPRSRSSSPWSSRSPCCPRCSVSPASGSRPGSSRPRRMRRDRAGRARADGRALGAVRPAQPGEGCSASRWPVCSCSPSRPWTCDSACPATRRPPPAAPSARPTTPLTDGFGRRLQRAADRGRRRPRQRRPARPPPRTRSRLLDDLPDVASVSPASFNETGDVALIRAVPGSSPTSEDTVGLVSDIRDRAPPCTTTPAPSSMVTGTTALNIDISGKLERRPDAVPVRGRRPRADPAHAGVPLDPRPAQGRRGLPAQRRSPPRRRRRRLPVGLARRTSSASTRPARS